VIITWTVLVGEVKVFTGEVEVRTSVVEVGGSETVTTGMAMELAARAATRKDTKLCILVDCCLVEVKISVYIVVVVSDD